MTSAEDLQKKITEETQQGEWELLKTHALRGSVILVGSDLSMTEAGMKIVVDDVKQVEIWLNEGKLTKVNNEHIADWDKTPKKVFDFVILQPFVLIQEQKH